jgi:hypothetical protein
MPPSPGCDTARRVSGGLQSLEPRIVRARLTERELAKEFVYSEDTFVGVPVEEAADDR